MNTSSPITLLFACLVSVSTAIGTNHDANSWKLRLMAQLGATLGG